MREWMRPLARCATLALVALAAAAASAGAFELEVEPAGEFTASGRWTFGTSPSIECDYTLSGTLAEGPIELMEGEQIGEVSSVRFSSCGGGRISAFLNLPWEVTIGEVLGTMPNEVEGILVVVEGFSFNISVFGEAVNCLYGGSPGMLMEFSRTRTAGVFQLGTGAWLSEMQWPKVSGGFLCPDEGSMSGEVAFSPGQTFTVGGEGDEGRETIEFSSAGEIAMDSLHAITFTGGSDSMTCNWELSGTLTRGAIRREEGATIGSISAARWHHCGGGSMSAVLGTAWDFKYVRTTGTLPEEATAVALMIDDYAVNLKSLGSLVGCLYSGDLVGELELSGRNPYPTGLWRLSEPRLELVRGERECPASIVATGTFWLDPEQEVRFEG